MTSNRSRPQGIFVGVGSLAVIAAGFIASAMPATDAALRFGVLVVTVFVFTAIADVWAAAVTVGVIGYLVFDGFLVNQLGELSWHGGADLSRVVGIAAAVTLGRLIGDGYRSSRQLRSGALQHPDRVHRAPAADLSKVERADSSRRRGRLPTLHQLMPTVVHIFDEEETRDA